MKKVIVLLMSLFLLTGCLEEEKLDKIAYTTYYPLEFATNYMYKDFATVKSIYPNGIDTSKYTLTVNKKVFMLLQICLCMLELLMKLNLLQNF